MYWTGVTPEGRWAVFVGLTLNSAGQRSPSYTASKTHSHRLHRSCDYSSHHSSWWCRQRNEGMAWCRHLVGVKGWGESRRSVLHTVFWVDKCRAYCGWKRWWVCWRYRCASVRVCVFERRCLSGRYLRLHSLGCSWGTRTWKFSTGGFGPFVAVRCHTSGWDATAVCSGSRTPSRSPHAHMWSSGSWHSQTQWLRNWESETEK